MAAFVKWFNKSESEISHVPVRAALVHLYFESIQPFEDGNGRIGRTLSEKPCPRDCSGRHARMISDGIDPPF